jgi:hypothetical protein
LSLLVTTGPCFRKSFCVAISPRCIGKGFTGVILCYTRKGTGIIFSGCNLTPLLAVRVTRDFLNAELRKYATWEDACKSDLINSLSQNWTSREFTKRKQEGVGQTTIMKFLGTNWKQHFPHGARSDRRGNKTQPVEIPDIMPVTKAENTLLSLRGYYWDSK